MCRMVVLYFCVIIKIYIINMKKGTLRLGVSLLIGAMLSSCSQMTDFQNQSEQTGKGMLSLSLSAAADFKSRAVVETEYENVDEYTVVVTDKYGVEVMNCKGAEMASQMPLVINVGDFTVQAFYGVDAVASRDAFYVYGETQGYIKPDEEVAATVVCTPTCGRLRVAFDENMADYFNDYKVEFTGTKAMKSADVKCEWKKDDTEPWYVKLEEGGETISFTITTETKEEFVNANQQKVATKTGTFSLAPNKGYKLNVAPSYTATGKLGLNITIDESTNDKPVDVEVPVEWT